MRQVLVKGGGVAVEEVPAPAAGPREILVRVAHSCVSVGTELTSVRMSGLPLYRRAVKQPHNVKRVLEVARDQGLIRTVRRVRGRLAAGVPTGYSAAGTVLEVGEEVVGFVVGDRVACAGAGIANHAEIIAVPVNLAVHVPGTVDLRLASTVTLGAIAMQGVRRAAPTLGETIGVIGLGIIGQITAQLLKTNGCRVVGADLDRARVEQALASGMDVGVDGSESFVEHSLRATDGFGLDAVIVTATSPSSEVVREAMRACRKKGRVIVVGDVGMHLERADMYEKELDLLISTSYGPGRYDPEYEEDGVDYPLPYVRWTENRNLAEYVRLLADGRLSLAELTQESYQVDQAPEAYAALQREGPKPLVVTISYPEREAARSRTVVLRDARPTTGRIGVALVGAGNFAEAMHLPNLIKLRDRFEIRWVMSRTGATARAVALRSEAARMTTDLDEVLADADVDLVLITTRHNTHASLALRALAAGKNVFVEKPLALTPEELDAIERFYEGRRDAPILMTGFNRRFAPSIVRAREILAGRRTPLIVDYRMNAGYLPPNHWVHGPEGGGRNIGEACHIYDLFASLTGAEVLSVGANAIRPTSRDLQRNDNFVATISYADGSVCTLTYTALGHRDHPKERMDIYADGKVLSLDDYRSLVVSGGRGKWRATRNDKGHLDELRALSDSLRTGGHWPITLGDQIQAMRVAFDVESQLR